MAAADKREITRQLNSSHGSFELVLSPVLMGLLGWWIDGRAGTSPVFVIGLALFGVVGAAVKVYYDYRSRMEAVSDAARTEREARAAEQAAKRQAIADEREALEQSLAAQLAEAEAAARPTGRQERVA
jgi:F0F1-type ATP synthase assembly protein I